MPLVLSLVAILRHSINEGLNDDRRVLILTRIGRCVQAVAVRIHPFAGLPLSGLDSAECGILWGVKVGNGATA